MSEMNVSIQIPLKQKSDARYITCICWSYRNVITEQKIPIIAIHNHYVNIRTGKSLGCCFFPVQLYRYENYHCLSPQTSKSSLHNNYAMYLHFQPFLFYPI